MKRKGIISIIEMVITAVVLLTAFSIIFSQNVYTNNWDRANLILNGRDIVTTIDNLGRLYYYSYNQSALSDFLLNTLGPSFIFWSETDGFIKNKLSIACNCTEEQISTLNSWLFGSSINGRQIEYFVCSTNLEKINPCASAEPDVLVIWGYKDINSSSIISALTNYLSLGNGIIEIADLPTNLDLLNKNIFGIEYCEDVLTGTCSYKLGEENDTIQNPSSVSQIFYGPYKLFYHLPLSVNSFTNASVYVTSVPTEGGIPSCESSSVFSGSFSFYERNHFYWICSNSVYFDTDNNNLADMSVSPQSDFSINSINFYMKNVNLSSFDVVFKKGYVFKDFLKDSGTKVYPSDSDKNKIFLHFDEYLEPSGFPVPVVVLNGTDFYKTAWVSDFTRTSLDSADDDHRLLFLSLLFWASDKHNTPNVLSNINFGFTTSYVNTINEDMFEVYTFSLGIGQPY